MTNYIVNKTTTEVFAVVADSMLDATKMVEQGNGVIANFNVAYNARPQTPQPTAAPQMAIPQNVGAAPFLRPMPLPKAPTPKVAPKK